ncbi:hypothetical protein HPB51_029355 [Rhipicephalus microplus]|uniref:RING-type domain-containing protein n=1 Tax=Rhipicephalus microplus TaxID=6941 RepID=A0A9J6CUI9_RHIMP|nr:hypothetical protein HPB51_029355 [Rhipicephalus microplus]
MEEAPNRDQEIVACGTEENVEQLFKSKEGEYETAVKLRSLSGRSQFHRQTSHSKRSTRQTSHCISVFKPVAPAASTLRRRLRREDPEMAEWEYTLTGFSDFLERRRVNFVEQLPQNRVCAVCGMVPSRSLILPCRHTLCRLCRSQITEQNGCPLDGRQFADADLLLVVLR